MARRFYQFEWSPGNPIYFGHIGHLLNISGLILGGRDKDIAVFTPNRSVARFPDMTYISPTWEEWDAIIKASDDPKYLVMDGHNIKAVHRKVRMQISGAVQQKVWVRDDLECQFCGREMGDVQLTVDHWIPLELGGANDPSNYITACRGCNKKKGNIHPKEFCKDNSRYNFNQLDNWIRENPI